MPTKCILIQLELSTFGPQKGERSFISKFDKKILTNCLLRQIRQIFFDINISSRTVLYRIVPMPRTK